MSGFTSFSSEHRFLHSLLAILQGVRARLRPLLVPLLVVATVALAAASGLVAFKLIPARFVDVVLAGIAFFLVVLFGAEFAILTLLFISATLLDVGSLPRLFGFSSGELTVLLLLGIVLINYLSSRENFVHTPLDWPILLFVGATIVSLLNAVYNLGTVLMFRNPITRMMLMYWMFFAVTNLIKTRRQLMRLVGGMFILATITASFIVIQQIAGSTISILPGQKQVYNATVLGQELVGVGRIALPGTALVYVMFFPAFILQTTREYMKSHKWMLLISGVLFSLAIAFTFTRGLWIGIAVSALVFIVISRGKSKKFVLLILALVTAAYLFVPLMGAYFPRVNTIAEGLLARFGSLFADDELVYDSSTQWRLKENDLALAKFEEYPIMGIGPGADYRASWYETDGLMYYVHNSYLWLLVDFGLIGLIPFAWFSIAYLVRAFLFWGGLQDEILSGLVISFALSYLAVLICSVTSPRLMNGVYVLLVSVILGIGEVAIRLDRESSQRWGKCEG